MRKSYHAREGLGRAGRGNEEITVIHVGADGRVSV